jgi:hypothetical protein
MLQLSLDNVGELPGFHDLRRRLFAHHRGRRRQSRRFLSSLSTFTQDSEMLPNLVGKLVVKRTGMRLPLNPEYGKIIQDEVTLHLQFTCQDVDSYVAHAVFLIYLPCFQPVG